MEFIWESAWEKPILNFFGTERKEYGDVDAYPLPLRVKIALEAKYKKILNPNCPFHRLPVADNNSLEELEKVFKIHNNGHRCHCYFESCARRGLGGVFVDSFIPHFLLQGYQKRYNIKPPKTQCDSLMEFLYEMPDKRGKVLCAELIQSLKKDRHYFLKIWTHKQWEVFLKHWSQNP